MIFPFIVLIVLLVFSSVVGASVGASVLYLRWRVGLGSPGPVRGWATGGRVDDQGIDAVGLLLVLYAFASSVAATILVWLHGRRAGDALEVCRGSYGTC